LPQAIFVSTMVCSFFLLLASCVFHLSFILFFFAGNSVPRQVILNFVCTPSVGANLQSVVIDGSNPCLYTVTFQTAASCPPMSSTAPVTALPMLSSSSTGSAPPTPTACSFGSVNLSPARLSTTDYSFSDPNYLYKFNPCGVTTDSVCASRNAALCQYTSSGTFVHALAAWVNPSWSYIGGNPSFGVAALFTNADTCYFNGNSQSRQVTIQFSCNPTVGQGYFQSITSDPNNPCIYSVIFPTALSCPSSPTGSSASPMLPSSSTGSPSPTSSCGYGNRDLSVLRLSASDYSASDSSYQYRLNLCGTTVEATCASKGGSLCQYTSTGTYIHVLSSWVSPSWSYVNNDPSQGIAATFASGDVCYNMGWFCLFVPACFPFFSYLPPFLPSSSCSSGFSIRIYSTSSSYHQLCLQSCCRRLLPIHYQ
jgi:hypothetical protein